MEFLWVVSFCLVPFRVLLGALHAPITFSILLFLWGFSMCNRCNNIGLRAVRGKNVGVWCVVNERTGERVYVRAYSAVDAIKKVEARNG